MSSFDERARGWDTRERIDRAASAAAAIRAAVPLARHQRVIEIGAGTGLLALALAPEVGSVVLTDPSSGMLEVASEKVAAAGLDNVRMFRFGLTVDPLPEERFDLAVSLMALHHVPDTDAGLAALHDVLEPGGLIALVDLDAEDGTFHSDPHAEVHHGFARDDLARRAEAAGYRDLALTTADRIAKDGRVYSLFLLTARRD